MNASQIDEIRLYRKDQVPEIFEIASSQGGHRRGQAPEIFYLVESLSL